MTSQKDLENIIQSVFESRYLKRIQRSGTTLLLGREVPENVAEHSFYTALFAIVIQHLKPELDLGKLLTLCITHDLEEVRIGDINLVNRFYQNTDNEVQAFNDMWQGSELGEKLIKLHKEGHTGESIEALAFKDCDILAELLLEKEFLITGNKEAEEWMDFTHKRLQTPEGKEIAKYIIEGRLSGWWEKIKNEIRKKQGVPAKDYN